MRHNFLLVSAAVATMAVSACSSATISGRNAYDPNLITFEQMSGEQNQSAYDAIRRLRPSFLTSRGPTTLLGTSSQYATVYVDGMRYGTIETLKHLPASWIASVRSHRVSSAGYTGLNEMGGVIEIRTREH
jgi:hypothetical protein